MTTIPQIMKDCRTAMEKSFKASKRELASIRTGKATISLLDTVRVDAYGQQMPLNQVGSVSAPEPRPALNEQRRKELVKVVHKLAEEARIGIRHARTAARDQLKKLEKTSEDDQKKAEKELQKLHDDYIGRIDELLKGKEAEIMEV